MGVEGCTKVIKYVLFFLNFFFWLAGGVILGVALWLRQDSKTSSLLSLQLDGNQAPNTFYISVYILIAVGAVMMFVGFLGCYGAIQESQCLLGTFFACLVILFACEVAAGVWGYMNKDSISKEMINFYDAAYDKVVADPENNQAAATVLKAFHESLDCCGKGDFMSVLNTIAKDVCPKDSVINLKSLTSNCHVKLREIFSDKLYIIGIVALVVAVIMIFEMIFSMVLCCGIRNSPVY
ncbi:hypothetical protein AGOR_G00170670 [Albula goreensis]|uniref:Tetraspanin n=1 Tax=Albula goreensis TaxID=1534307 RepID=A0A8T3D1A2_9TELE|nr:hypothetical protein AGOR_G00170670 [Albula goreensis]